MSTIIDSEGNKIMEMEDIIALLNSEIQVDSCDEFPSQEIKHKLGKFGYSIKFVDCVGRTDKHRWYELKNSVFEVFNGSNSIGFVMSDLIIQVYSESSSFEDICYTPEFVECVPKIVEITTYVEKEKIRT